jgi:hypothetical protein
MNRTLLAIAAVALMAAGIGGYLWNQRSRLQDSTPPAVASAPEPAAPAAPAASPGIRHPIEPLLEDTTSQPLPKLERSDAMFRTTLVDWLGRESVQSFLQLDDFARHAVATVDNLGRSHAAPRLWPVNPMAGRYAVIGAAEGTVAAPGNAERYATFVAFAERIDTRQAVALYARWYPLFQQAYEELGYPGGYFNDRLIVVLDQLIATPVVEGPIELKVTEVKGPIASTQPWLRYEFADPAFEALPAGQKMLLRMGPRNQQRLQAKLAEVRRQLTARPPTR